MSRRRSRRPKPTTDKRTPEQRIEALIREPNHDRATRMIERIRDDLDADPSPGPWIAAARTLSERLIISEDAFHYFAVLFGETLILPATQSDPELIRIHDAMEAIERAHGLRDDEYWQVDEGPDDWRALNEEWHHRANDIIVSSLRELGHGDVADLLDKDPDEFERRSENGRVEVWGEDEEEHDHDHEDDETT